MKRTRKIDGESGGGKSHQSSVIGNNIVANRLGYFGSSNMELYGELWVAVAFIHKYLHLERVCVH